MKNNFKNTLAYTAVTILFALSCSSSEKASTNKNVAGIYMPGLNLIDPDYKLFHRNDTVTELHFRLNSEDILYTKKRGDTTFTANISIKYELLEKSSETLIDSSSIFFSDFRVGKSPKVLDGFIEIPTDIEKKYDLVVTASDLNRDHYIKKRLSVNRIGLYHSENFLILDSNNSVVFKDHFNFNDKVRIKKNTANSKKTILLKYYNSKLPLAKPPFSVDENKEPLVFEPAYTKKLEFDTTGILEYVIDKRGLYHFQGSEEAKEGPTLFNFQEYFPKIKSPNNMVKPMRYITTKKEYASLNESENKKEAVDNFWIKISGSTDRARTLIREYYSRVENANNYFTSYIEGWKTDRGLIYIIYGSPNVVYKNKNYENWIYGEENNMMSINFVFHKVDNPVSNNDFTLSRSPIFKNSWYRAVDSWRNGRIY